MHRATSLKINFKPVVSPLSKVFLSLSIPHRGGDMRQTLQEDVTGVVNIKLARRQ
jgi:hypothetical protein